MGMGPMAGGGLGILGLVLVLLLGGNVVGGGDGSPSPLGGSAPDPDDEQAEFVGFVVDNVQDFWTEESAGSGASTSRPSRVTPETWTHGSAEQRVSSFRRGFQGGSLQTCVSS